MIITDNYLLTYKSFLKIKFALFLRKKWWTLGLLLGVLILIALDGERDSSEKFYSAFIIIILLSTLSKLWSDVYSKENRMLLLERNFEIYSDKIIERYGESMNLIKIEHFVKIVQLRKFYLLYTSKDNFIIISNESFRNELDRVWFDREIVSKIPE